MLSGVRVVGRFSAMPSRTIPLAACALCAAALTSPLLSRLGLPLAAFALRQFFALVCHQDPQRSFWILGAPLAVCARCFGIYLGAALAAFAPRMRAARELLLAALIANAADVLAEAAGLHGDWKWTRFVLGCVLGAAAVLVVRAGSVMRRAAAG